MFPIYNRPKRSYSTLYTIHMTSMIVFSVLVNSAVITTMLMYAEHSSDNIGVFLFGFLLICMNIFHSITAVETIEKDFDFVYSLNRPLRRAHLVINRNVMRVIGYHEHWIFFPFIRKR